MKDSPKDCFGVLRQVFPMGDGGMREVPERCFECPEKTPCMKAALDTREGIALKGDLLERSPAGGFLGRLRRWSEKKELSARLRDKGKKPACG